MSSTEFGPQFGKGMTRVDGMPRAANGSCLNLVRESLHVHSRIGTCLSRADLSAPSTSVAFRCAGPSAGSPQALTCPATTPVSTVPSPTATQRCRIMLFPFHQALAGCRPSSVHRGDGLAGDPDPRSHGGPKSQNVRDRDSAAARHAASESKRPTTAGGVPDVPTTTRNHHVASDTQIMRWAGTGDTATSPMPWQSRRGACPSSPGQELLSGESGTASV
jgi:hypothetical protein